MANRLAQAHRPKRRRDELQIEDLYTAIGQQLQLEKLGKLTSFQDFAQNLRAALRQLNFLD
ncbi:MAG: hypothetical protein MUC97_01440 [Bernardetiaceae bacterium]|nr:hypothetical protein [Bernardetiaceae bacterium]